MCYECGKDIWILCFTNILFFPGLSWTVELNITKPKKDSKHELTLSPMSLRITSPGGFSCNRCGKKYSLKGTLTRHMRFECGQKPQFHCPVCNKPFTRNDTLSQHIKVIHSQTLSFINQRN